MTSTQIMNGFVTFLGVFALIAFFYGPWQWMVTDAVRQRWFEIRDGAFDVAAAGELEFADPHYQAFRKSVNRLINNADQSSIWRGLALYALRKRLEAGGFKPEPTLSGEGQIPKYLMQAEKRVYRWYALMLWLRSPLLITFTFVALFLLPIALILAAASSSLRRVTFEFADQLNSIVVDEATMQASGRHKLAS